MVTANLHIICGNCGSNKDFEKIEVERCFDGENHFNQVSIPCGNCSTIHFLDEDKGFEVEIVEVQE